MAPPKKQNSNGGGRARSSPRLPYDIVANLIMSVFCWSAATERNSAYLGASLVIKGFTAGELGFFMSIATTLMAYLKPEKFHFQTTLAVALATPLAYWMVPLLRPWFIEICLACHAITFGKLLASSNSYVVKRTIFCHFLGLPFVMCMRLFFASANPLWINTIFSLVATVSAAFAYYQLVGTALETDKDNVKRVAGTSTATAIQAGFVVATIDFACELISSQAGLMPRWAGVEPLSVSSFVIAASLAGSVLADLVSMGVLLEMASFVGLIVSWWMLGSVESSTVRFAAGLAVIFLLSYVGNNTYVRLSQMSAKSLPLVIASSFVAKVLFNLLCICAVAYRNMAIKLLKLPREHTVGIIASLLGIAAYLVIIHWAKSLRARDSTRHPSLKKKWFFVLAVVLAIAGQWYSSPKYVMSTEDGVNTPFTAAMWNVQLGYSEDYTDNLVAVTERLGRVMPSIVGIAESDASKILTGNRDIIQYMTSRLGYQGIYGARTSDHSFGSSILTRFPIQDVVIHHLPSVVGRKNIVAAAQLLVNNRPVWALTTHLALTEDTEDHYLQTTMVRDIAKHYVSTGVPVVLLSYINALLGDVAYMRMIDGGLQDSWTQANVTSRYCQYIFHQHLNVDHFEVYHAEGVTDTELQVGHFLFKD
eukprot:GILK01004331.1.p1 GENE.GILK01004331.1~~GILK01004331.1.p1  ORF type:complete len:647 (-),score=83.33 GILK01004331.1:189-2129(-)